MTPDGPAWRSDLPVILLAAGASARMRGRDKLLEPVDGQPLLRRQALLAKAVTRAPVFVTLPPQPHARYAALDGVAVTGIAVDDAAEGINASLRAGFAALAPETPAAMVMLADMPDLTENDIKTVLQAYDPKSKNLVWRGVGETGQPGHPAIFAAPLFAAFQTLEGDSGGHAVMARARGRIALVHLPDSDACADLDTPEDWDNWRETRRP